MAEGLFAPSDYEFIDGFPTEKILSSAVKVTPKRKLVFDVFDNEQERDAWSTGFEVDERGFETMKAGYTKNDVEMMSNPEFSNQIGNFEFYQLYKGRSKFPTESHVMGSASGFFLGPNGLIVTNYHIASGIIASQGFDSDGYTGPDLIPAPSISVEVVSSLSSNLEPSYRKIEEVYLAGSYSSKDAYGNKIDLAVLKIDLKPSNYLDISSKRVALHEKVYSIGFPMRTARSDKSRKYFNYNDANYDLRVSSGLVVKKEETNFLTDTDGGPGNSGSMTVDANGDLVGVYCGSVGNGIASFQGVLRRHCYAADIVPISKYHLK